jgi:hypothetical protein
VPCALKKKASVVAKIKTTLGKKKRKTTLRNMQIYFDGKIMKYPNAYS